MLGVSYPGWLTVMAMLDPHPALKAVSPQASPASMFLGDDFHHNGAFRLSYGFEYVAMMESGKEITPFDFDQYDTYSWYLSLGSLKTITDSLPQGKFPTWNNYVAHPELRRVLAARERSCKYLDRVTVPTLNVAGWWDQEDFYGPITIYRALEPHDTKHLNYLVVGPVEPRRLARRAPATSSARSSSAAPRRNTIRKNIELPWFAYWLKDKGKLELAEATTFETGANEWRSYDSWPPKREVTDAASSTSSPAASWRSSRRRRPSRTAPSTRTSSDPAKPVPYRARPILPTYGPGSTWSQWLVDDQRFADGPPRRGRRGRPLRSTTTS